MKPECVTYRFLVIQFVLDVTRDGFHYGFVDDPSEWCNFVHYTSTSKNNPNYDSRFQRQKSSANKYFTRAPKSAILERFREIYHLLFQSTRDTIKK